MSIIIDTEHGRLRKAEGTLTGWLLECPGCGEWLPITKKMFEGDGSVHHASQGCPGGYHETHDFEAALFAEGMRHPAECRHCTQPIWIVYHGKAANHTVEPRPLPADVA